MSAVAATLRTLRDNLPGDNDYGEGFADSLSRGPRVSACYSRTSWSISTVA